MSPLRRLVLIVGLCSMAAACADEGEPQGLPAPDENADPSNVPSESEALLAWLVAEPYLDWPAESAIHDSTGPHFGNVRTWINPQLEDSLDQGAAVHPAGAAAVKELYGSGGTRRGWAVGVKLDDGATWYWYEWYDGSLIAEGDDISLCSGCHSGGSDFVLTPFPLQ